MTTPTVPGERRTMPVPEGLDGMRLDSAIARLFGFSRTVAATLIDGGNATIDGLVRGRSDRVVGGTWLEIVMPPPAAPPVPASPKTVDGLRIVHADDDLLVIDKPPGVAAHAAPGYEGPTVTEGLAAAGYQLATSGAAERQGIVHRLDAGTSGLMVVARGERAYSVLKQQFRDREVAKSYRALVQGHPDPLRGTIDAPIDRHPRKSGSFAVVADGRPSVTHYDTEEAFRAACLLWVRLETGRTHQIRVHMSALHHPCVGDIQYGADPTLAARLGLTRQWLHAARLGFAHPTGGRWVEFESPDPPDLAAALEKVRAES